MSSRRPRACERTTRERRAHTSSSRPQSDARGLVVVEAVVVVASMSSRARDGERDARAGIRARVDVGVDIHRRAGRRSSDAFSRRALDERGARSLARGRAYASEAASVASAVSSASRVPLGSTLVPTWKAPGSAGELAAVCYGLSKFRLSAFVVSTTAAGFALESPENIDLEKMFYACAGTMMCSASANTLNQVSSGVRTGDAARGGTTHAERTVWDGVRVDVRGRVRGGRRRDAGGDDERGGGGVEGGEHRAVRGGVHGAQRVHFLNTWVGAIAGGDSAPGMCTANETGALDPGAYVLGAALYLWQIPHFMALAYMGKDDYFNGGYRMLSHPMYDRQVVAWPVSR